MSGNLTRKIDLSRRQEELGALLKRQAKLYTMGDSDSLPVETMQELLHSICFLLEAGQVQAVPDDCSLEELFAAGGRAVWQLLEEAKVLHSAVRQASSGYGSIAHRDTLDAIDDFFRAYDLRFFAHDIPCMMDYPLCLPAPEHLEGVLFIGEYLRRLLLESRFCCCFEQRVAVQALRRFQPDYRELVVNLFEPVLTCALGLVLLDKEPEPLLLLPEDCERLYGWFHPWRDSAAEKAIRNAAHQLCARLRLWDTAMRGYVEEAAGHLPPLLKASSREGFQNLFCSG